MQESENLPVQPERMSERVDDGQSESRIRELLLDQPYGVLCTQGDTRPYGALVAFAIHDDLTHLVFATPVSTRKYRLLTGCPNVAVVFDSRSRGVKLGEIEGVTAIGAAQFVERGELFDRLAAQLVLRHPDLSEFVHAPTTAIFRVDVDHYIHVSLFQQLREWRPHDKTPESCEAADAAQSCRT